jgi:hypothetical protein
MKRVLGFTYIDWRAEDEVRCACEVEEEQDRVCARAGKRTVSPISPSATIASNCESSGPGVVSEIKTQSEYYTEMMPVTFSDHASTNADHDLRCAPAISTGTRRRNNLDVTGGGRRGQEGGGGMATCEAMSRRSIGHRIEGQGMMLRHVAEGGD